MSVPSWPCKMIVSVVIILAILCNFCEANSSSILATFVKNFRAPKPLSLFYDIQKEQKVALTKASSLIGLSLRWVEDEPFLQNNLLYLLETEEIPNESDRININQQIYFLTSSLNLYEKYTINGKIIVQRLGHFLDDKYQPMNGIDEIFLKRRQNFHGVTMVTLTAHRISRVEIENLENAPYFHSNETYDVTDFLVGGTLYQVWKHLQATLNFTSKIYKRKVDVFGVPDKLQNGTFQLPDGYVNDVFIGKADVMLYINILYERFDFIDFMSPIQSQAMGIFVKRNSLGEGFDLTVFWRPFEKWTWTILIFSSLLISICIVFAWKIFNRKTNIVPYAMKVFVMSLQSNLGTGSFEIITNQFDSIKIIFFTALMCGNIIWLAYNGSLLSELIAPKVVKPFHDLETLSKTTYRSVKTAIFSTIVYLLYIIVSLYFVEIKLYADLENDLEKIIKQWLGEN